MTDRRPLLRAIFDAAVAAAHPDVVLAQHLPPAPKGRVICLAAGKGAGAVQQIQIQAVPVPLQAVPLPIQPAPAREALPANNENADVRKQALDGIGTARDRLRLALETLKDIPGASGSESMRKLREQIEAADRRLAETEEQIDK